MRDLPHPFWAKYGETEKGHMTAVRNDLPGIAAHTAAGGPKRARGSVTFVTPSLSDAPLEAIYADPHALRAQVPDTRPTAPPPAATTVDAAADTRKVSSIFFTRSDASSRVRPLISSRIVSTFAMIL